MNDFRSNYWDVDAPLTGVSVERSGQYAAFAGGDGCVRVIALSDNQVRLKVWSLTQGAILALIPDCRSPLFLCGADDGRVYRLHPEHGPQALVQLNHTWPDQLASHARGLRAVADGKQVRLLDASDQLVSALGPHPSTVAGIAFGDCGRRLAVSHYNGVSLWQLDKQNCKPQHLYYRGSHLNLNWRKDDRYLVTATQEKNLHAWDLVAGREADLGPCLSKVKALSWSADGTWLLGSGVETVGAWSFAAGLPTTTAPRMLGRYSERLIGQVCAHPHLALTAAGYNDGGLELIGLTSLPYSKRLISAPGSAVCGLAWSLQGDYLLGGNFDGQLFVFRFDINGLTGLVSQPDKPDRD